MPDLNESLDALVYEPFHWGMRAVWPMPRTDGPQGPFEVYEVDEGDDSQVISYRGTKQNPMKGSLCLIPSDIVWHQPTNVIGLVVARLEHRRARVQGLVIPDNEEDMARFLQLNGTGVWCCVAQGWKHEWNLPKEIAQLPEMVNLADGDDVLDLLPNTRREGRKSWVAEGLIDPDAEPTPNMTRYLAKQQAAMQKLAQGIDPETGEEWVPSTEDLEPGEVRQFVIPFDKEE